MKEACADVDYDLAWKVIMMYCPNCGKLVQGYQKEDKTTKMECHHCGVKLLSKQKGRRHHTIDMYAPEYQECLVH